MKRWPHGQLRPAPDAGYRTPAAVYGRGKEHKEVERFFKMGLRPKRRGALLPRRGRRKWLVLVMVFGWLASGLVGRFLLIGLPVG